MVPLLILLLQLLLLKQLPMLLLLLLLPTTTGAKEVPMAMVNPVLEANAGMALFLEKVAKITHPILRYKVITNGFDDLDELAQMEPEHAARTCNVIRRSTGSVLTKDISTKQELVLKRLIQWAIFSYMIGREFGPC